MFYFKKITQIYLGDIISIKMFLSETWTLNNCYYEMNVSNELNRQRAFQSAICYRTFMISRIFWFNFMKLHDKFPAQLVKICEL